MRMMERAPLATRSWKASFLTHLKARVALVRDVFHREWNDCNNALKMSGLWWVLLLTSATFNLCCGPWEGQFEKIKGGALELFWKQRNI